MIEPSFGIRSDMRRAFCSARKRNVLDDAGYADTDQSVKSHRPRQVEPRTSGVDWGWGVGGGRGSAWLVL